MEMKIESKCKIENEEVLSWILELEELCNPLEILLIDGSEEQIKKLTENAIKSGEIEKLNEEKLPNCYLHRTNENDVARVEDRTFICTKNKKDVGVTNNWIEKKEMYEKLMPLFKNSMQNKIMYIIPFSMADPESEFSKIGIEVTDSIYVVLNMVIMTRVNETVIRKINNGVEFTKCLHAKKDLNLQERYIAHFPEDNTIWSINSAYGGNVLLGKKCLALRLGSYMAKSEGWLAEHMLIIEIKDLNRGKRHYVAAAFPSACGKTNLAMLDPPESLKDQYEIRTIGDDIAWIRVKDERFWAINPEFGFFGVAPGTNLKTNPNALRTTQKDTIFTNVLKKDDNTVWWEGLENEPETGIDWKGNVWNKKEPGAHPNSRFTSKITNCPCISDEWNSLEGVPLSAIIFGGRRADTTPLVYESFDWSHGVFVGSIMSSETTSAAVGKTGVLKHDPMAMISFCGYNIVEYWNHWIKMGKIKNPPKIFNVNWFRKDGDKFLWPGFGENLRIIDWIIKRCENEVKAQKTKIGYVPCEDDINLSGLEKIDIKQLLKVNEDEWRIEARNINDFFKKFESDLPGEFKEYISNLNNDFI